MALDNIYKELSDEILKRADIAKVISCFLNVTKKGKEFVAICPFHDDTDPSLHIAPEKRVFKCFSCGTGGNAITFVMKYLHISFFEAMQKVAEIIGFDDPRLKGNKKAKPVDEKKVPLLKCLEDLTLYYSYALNTPEGKEGLDYFEERHLDADIRSKYKLGYAFRDGKATIAFLQGRGHSLKTIEDVGIASINGSNYSDKNQGRVIFPICDQDGNVIGYSARRIRNTDESKYINSPETYLFHKSSVLYNYHIAKEKAKIATCIYVCEGFMDVFALSKIGIDNAVALMGTAFTDEHIAIFKHLNVEVKLCLDGDLPGQTAMLKICSLLKKSGLKYSIIDNRNSTKDPDEILNEDGPDALRAYLSTFLSPIDFALNYYQNSNPLKTIDEKKILVKRFIPFLLGITSQLEFDSYIRKLSNVTGFDVQTLRDYVNANKVSPVNDSGDVSPVITLKDFHPERKALRKLIFAEHEILYQMIHNESARAFYENKVDGFVDKIYRALADFIIDYASNHQQVDPIDLISSLENSDLDNKQELIDELTNLYFDKTSHPDNCTSEYLQNLLDSITSEKEKVYKEDLYRQSSQGKDPLEQARILANYNRQKAMLEHQKNKK